ncbi:HAMP domain-containing sensor histidine kinase [Bacillus gobiensis]|uniref:sensor histidine kinase n=1 Tax=Bacillus gobiensis TaxID=1441095 RepID=UPI003D1D7503
MNILQSLMTRYLLLILCALVLLPIIPAIYYFPQILFNRSLYDIQELESMWKREAAELDDLPATEIDLRLQELHKKYPESEIFWIDKNGNSRFVLDRPADIPENWTFVDALAFLEENKFEATTFLQNGDPQDTYTISSLIGNDPNQGIMVFRVLQLKTNLGNVSLFNDYLFIAFFFIVSGAFLLLSWFFFVSIRKRLIQLQSAMSDTGTEGIPDEVVIRKKDEIGRLQGAFNEMIRQLRSSRESEQKEEQLRKQLFANISHDLRTPLTVIRQHAYSVQMDPSSPKGRESLQIVVNKLGDVDKMINNLLSYTLLTAGKHPINKKDTDILDVLRNSIAEWYPVFEKHGFQVDIDLPEKALIWHVDSLWFRSILDNLFQNVLRHANSGKYIGIKTVERNGSTFIAIKDKGEGFEHESEAKGAGIGLSIVSLMTKEMGLVWEVAASSDGTCIYLGREKLNKT